MPWHKIIFFIESIKINTRLNELIAATKNWTGIITLKLSSTMIGNTNNETNFPNKFEVTDWQVSKLCKAFANNLSVVSNYQKLSKTIQSGEFLGRLLFLDCY